MTTTQNAQDKVSFLLATVEYEHLLPIRVALDRLQRLEREPVAASNREVLARELFTFQATGSARDDLRTTWDTYLQLEAAGFPAGEINPRELLARYRAEADRFITVLNTVKN